MTLFAKAIGIQEGFGIPGKIPTIRHNRGDLRHGPHMHHPGGPGHANDVGTADTVEEGDADLERQLQIFAAEQLTIRQAIYVYLGVPKDATAEQVAAAPDHNNVGIYLAGVCKTLGLQPEALVSEALKLQA